jgi:hypothetical protein
MKNRRVFRILWLLCPLYCPNDVSLYRFREKSLSYSTITSFSTTVRALINGFKSALAFSLVKMEASLATSRFFGHVCGFLIVNFVFFWETHDRQ